MAFINNDRKINSLLQQMQEKVGLSEYKAKAEAKQKEEENMSALIKDLSKIDQQDPMRISPIVNENNREERKIEELRHRERQNVMMRVNIRQRMRESRSYE